MSANDRQEGGSHYKSTTGIQHWDLVVMYRWDYFQSQITKYVMRWKDKHGTHEKRLMDLKKARHFLDKYIEEAEQWDDHKARHEPPVLSGSPEDLRVNLTPNLDPAKNDKSPDWQCEGWYGDMTNLYRCKHCRALLRAPDVLGAIELHGAPCPLAPTTP